MSRSRVVFSAFFAGILITTGGCTASPTAVSADDALQGSAVHDDAVIVAGPMEEEMSTLSSGYLYGGGRAATQSEP